MQAIETKYICPTNTRGARLKASCGRGSIIISYPDEFNMEKAHIKAANELITKFNVMDALQYGKESVKSGKGWNTPFVTGQLKDGTFVHVYITEAPTQTF